MSTQRLGSQFLCNTDRCLMFELAVFQVAENRLDHFRSRRWIGTVSATGATISPRDRHQSNGGRAGMVPATIYSGLSMTWTGTGARSRRNSRWTWQSGRLGHGLSPSGR